MLAYWAMNQLEADTKSEEALYVANSCKCHCIAAAISHIHSPIVQLSHHIPHQISPLEDFLRDHVTLASSSHHLRLRLRHRGIYRLGKI